MTPEDPWTYVCEEHGVTAWGTATPEIRRRHLAREHAPEMRVRQIVERWAAEGLLGSDTVAP